MTTQLNRLIRNAAAVLACTLEKVALDTVDWRLVARMHRVQRERLVIMPLTFGLTVFLDLVAAVAVGMIAAAVTSARQFERLELDKVMYVLVEQLIDTATMQDINCIVMGLSGSPASTPGVLDIPRRVPQYRIVETLDMTRKNAARTLADHEAWSRPGCEKRSPARLP